MTKREMQQRHHMLNALQSLGFTVDECEKLRRISMCLRSWHEQECGTGNGCIERDEATNKPYWHNSHTGRRWAIADRETGALKRLAKVVGTRNARIDDPHSKDAEQYIHATCHAMLAGKVSAYVQGDPRGAALYILRPGDVPEGKDADAYYSRGICVY